jgi:hypothetical protein
VEGIALLEVWKITASRMEGELSEFYVHMLWTSWTQGDVRDNVNSTNLQYTKCLTPFPRSSKCIVPLHNCFLLIPFRFLRPWPPTRRAPSHQRSGCKMTWTYEQDCSIHHRIFNHLLSALGFLLPGAHDAFRSQLNPNLGSCSAVHQRASK